MFRNPRPPSYTVVSLKGKYGDTLATAPPASVRMCCMSLNPAVARLVANFLEGAAVFGLSRMWYDLIAAYLLGLQPVPFCGTAYHETACTSPAAAYPQSIFTIVVIVVTGLMKHLAEHYKIAEWGGMWDDVPTISNYLAGWAAAGALTQAVVELKQAYPIICESSSFGYTGDCLGFDLVFAVALTVVLSMIIIIIQPFAERIECGDNSIIDFIEDLAEDIVAMVKRACSVVIMVWWYNTLCACLTLDPWTLC